MINSIIIFTPITPSFSYSHFTPTRPGRFPSFRHPGHSTLSTMAFIPPCCHHRAILCPMPYSQVEAMIRLDRLPQG